MTIAYVNSNLPGAQAIGKLYLNDQKLAGMAAQGEFDELELDDIYTAINNRKYERNVLLGNTLATYTNWSHLESGSGYGIWKYPITVFTDDDNNELYRNDVKLSYQGAAASESTTAGFTKNYLSNSKRSGETFTDITTEAATSSGTPFNLAVSTSYTSAVTPVASGLNLDYTNILLGSVSVQTLASVSSYVSYSEDTDYEISYTSGVITLLSGTSITGAVQMSYNVGSTLYTGLSGATFGGISVGLAQRGVGNVYVYDYYLSGTGWTSFSPDPDGTNGYSNDGNITFSGLTGWGSTTVNSQDLYWVRQRFTTPGIILPTGWYILQAGSSVGTLLSLTSKEIKENSFKWCYYNDNIYVAIPSAGASNQEGNLYLKSTSATTNKQNYFVYNNVYMSNYRNTTTASGLTQSETSVTNFDIVITNGLITSFTKN